MKNKDYEKMYDWNKLIDLFEKFLPELVDTQENLREEDVIENLSKDLKNELKSMDFSEEGKEPEEVAQQLLDKVYPYRMKINHPRYFCFIPNHVTPYSVFGDFLNSIHNPYGGGISISEGVGSIEEATIKWMGEQIGYDKETLGGQFVSGGSMANLTATVVARDDKLKPEEFIKATAYVSDQTHSSVAKAIHIMGISRENVRKVPTDNQFKLRVDQLEKMIQEDISKGYKPFLVVGTAGTTNTGAIDPLEDIASVAEKYKLWYHVDGAFGATAILSSHRHLLKGIEKSDSVSWDGHKWLFQTYGCATVICKDKMKMVKTFQVDPEYLKDVESTDEDINFWDMGLELTKPARGMRLWFTLQTMGVEAMRDAIDHGFKVADWIEEEISKYDHYEIVSHSNMGIINFRYYNDKYSEEELDQINKKLSQRAVEENYAAFFTTELKGKIVLRFCTLSPQTKREEIEKIVQDLEKWIKEIEEN